MTGKTLSVTAAPAANPPRAIFIDKEHLIVTGQQGHRLGVLIRVAYLESAMVDSMLVMGIRVAVAKTRMTFSVGGQGAEVLRSRMQSASEGLPLAARGLYHSGK
jgi:hypothetical protein